MDNAALNKAIAEQVMGFTVAEQFCVRDPDTGEWEHAFWVEDQSVYADDSRYQMRPCFYVIEVGEWYPLPNYSEDIAAAFIVVEQMIQRGHEYRLRYRDAFWGDDRHECVFLLGALCAAAAAKIPALAICLAAIHTINDSALQSTRSE